MNIILLDDPRWKDFFPVHDNATEPESKRQKPDDTLFTTCLEDPDPRYIHIVRHLKKGVGDTVRIGFLGGGPIGEATLIKTEENPIDNVALQVNLRSLRAPPHRPCIQLLLGVSFPKVVKHLWPVLASFAVDTIVYAPSELTNRAFLKSSALTEPEYSKALREGLSQAEETRLPKVCVLQHLSISDFVSPSASQVEMEDYHRAKNTMPLESDPSVCKIVLHVGGTYPSIRQCVIGKLKSQKEISRNVPPVKVVLAIGPERGWTDTEINIFQVNQWQVASLGSPILKTETAVISGVALARDVLMEYIQ